MTTSRIAIITGAGRGIGAAIAHRLADDGYAVVVADLDEERAAETSEAIAAGGGTASAARVDVGERDQVFDLVERTVADFGRLDTFVSNAGIIQVKDFDQITTEDWQRMMRVNVEGVLYGLQAASRAMLDRGEGGKIINASSTAGRSGSAMAMHYSASKASVIAMTQAAARALAPNGITVNAYCPGLVETDMQTQIDRETTALLGTEAGSYLAGMQQAAGIGRFLTPDEIAGVVSFLASPDSNGVTGQAITIDGGRLFI